MTEQPPGVWTGLKPRRTLWYCPGCESYAYYAIPQIHNLLTPECSFTPIDIAAVYEAAKWVAEYSAANTHRITGMKSDDDQMSCAPLRLWRPLWRVLGNEKALFPLALEQIHAKMADVSEEEVRQALGEQDG